MSLAEKETLVESYEKPSLSQAAFAKLHGIPITTVNNVLSSKSSTKKLKKRQEKMAMYFTFQQD